MSDNAPDPDKLRLTPELLETVDVLMARQGLDRERSSRLTIRPRLTPTGDDTPDLGVPSLGLWDHLPVIAVAPHSDLVVHDVLGTGGMGVVEVARQRSLEREVALKTIRPEKLSNRTIEALLREARLAGQLDHPNIIPIHALGRDAERGPLMIMKRVEGTSWEALLDGEPMPRDLTALERHLDVLHSVCNAVAFAHSRGILHRDIKPANVMVGEFGEVYVLDWGVALRLDDREQEADVIVGSPAYMAPEMLEGARGVSERTDVFLLGATLHEVLTGQVRHTPTSMADCVEVVARVEPFDYGDDVPPELAALCNRACARDPRERFASVTAFQDALTAFRSQRSSQSVTRAALANLEALRGELGSDDVHPTTVQRLFESGRAGFRDALAAWPDNRDAREGLAALYERMIGYALQTRNAAGARTLLDEAPRRLPELEARLEALEGELRTQAAAHERLESLQIDLQRTGEDWGRSSATLFSGALWFLILITTSWGLRAGWIEGTRWQGVWFALLWVGVFLAFRWLLRAWLVENAIFKQLMRLALLMPVMVLCNHLLSVLDGRTLHEVIVSNFLIVALSTAMGALTFERQLSAPAALLVLGGVGAALSPDHALDIAGALALLLNGWLAWLMRPTRAEARRSLFG